MIKGSCTRWQVIESATHSSATRASGWYVHRPAKVGNLQVALVVQQQVFRLDVAVNHILRVKIAQCTRKLCNILQRTHRHTQPKSNKQKNKEEVELVNWEILCET